MLKRLLLVVVLIAVTLSVTVAPAAAQDGVARTAPCVVTTLLAPENEVRTPANTNDPTVESVARGRAVFLILPSGTIIFHVQIFNPARETFVAGHIHIGPPNANGPVVVGLFSGSTNTSFFRQFGFLTTTPAIAAAICANPSAYYVNYHTTQDPVGATRGQLR